MIGRGELNRSLEIIGETPVIGIVGPIASGKGTIVDIISAGFNFKNYTFSSSLKKVLQGDGVLPPYTREQLTQTRNWLHQHHGKGVLGELVLSTVAEDITEQPCEGVTIDGLRHLQEFNHIKSIKNVLVIWVEADKDTRFERLLQRDRVGDTFKREDFTRIDSAELESMMPIREYADLKIENTGSVNEVTQQIIGFVNSWLKS